MGAVQSVEDVLLRPVHWTAALPATLRQIGVADLLSPIGLDFESYGTARMMARVANEARRVIGKVDPPVGAMGGLVLLECLPSRAVAELDAVGLSLRGVDDSTVPADVGVLRQAWHLTHAVWPELSSSVGHLVRCVHLLKAPSPEVDCSFSRPDLPFSVFLSVPDHGTHARIERVTEALVHETMHLQLSLLERRIPLVESDRPGNCHLLTVAELRTERAGRAPRAACVRDCAETVEACSAEDATRTGPEIRRGARACRP